MKFVVDLFESLKKFDMGSIVSAIFNHLSELLLSTPPLTDSPAMMEIWNMIRIISCTCLAMIFVWEGFKSSFETSYFKGAEAKVMIKNLLFNTAFMLFSTYFIDILIKFNNAIVQTMAANVDLQLMVSMSVKGIGNAVLAIILVAVICYYAIQLIIYYYVRIVQIQLLTVLSPAVFMLGVSPYFSGYITTWFTQLTTTIFTQAIQAVIIALFTKTATNAFQEGGLDGIFRATAMLMLMVKAPSMLSNFTRNNAPVNPFNELKMIKNRVENKVSSTWSGARKIARRIGRK